MVWSVHQGASAARDSLAATPVWRRIALWGGARSLLVQEADPLFIARRLRDAYGDRVYALLTRHQRPEEQHEER